MLAESSADPGLNTSSAPPERKPKRLLPTKVGRTTSTKYATTCLIVADKTDRLALVRQSRPTSI